MAPAPKGGLVCLGYIAFPPAMIVLFIGSRATDPAEIAEVMMRDFLELTKPRITVLILICTAVGYFLGAANSFHLSTACPRSVWNGAHGFGNIGAQSMV